MMRDLLVVALTSAKGIERKSSMVISPRGAMNKTGVAGNDKSFNTRYLNTIMPNTMAKARGKESGFNNSSVWIKNPKRIKNKVLIRNAASAVNSFNLETSKTNSFDWMKDSFFQAVTSSTLRKKRPNSKIKIKAGKWYSLAMA